MDSSQVSSSASNPTSALLQDMIKEKRAQTQRVPKTRDASGGSWQDLEQRGIQSSPLNAASMRDRHAPHLRQASAVGNGKAAPHKEMGLREMQEHISRVDKQNFDLKLEIFHRRQRNEILESKVEKLETLEAENEEIRSENEDLSLQLEKRDADLELREAAIEEAVGMICDLEARVEELQQEILSKIDPQIGLSAAGHNVTVEPPTTPIQVRKAPISEAHSPGSLTATASSSKSPLRPISLLAKNKRSSVALRSLYASGNPSFTSLARPSSIFSDEELVEELDRQMLASPRLSILSESGFSSIYGHNHDRNETILGEESPGQDQFSPSKSTSSAAAQREARISDWVEENKMQERPTTPVRSSANELTRGRFSSIDAALGRDVPPVPPHRNPLRNQPSSHASSTSSGRRRSEKISLDERSPTKSLRKSARAHEKLSSHGGSVFGGNNLPPTPETMSTATIGASSSTQSILTEKSQADGPYVPTRGYAAYRRDRPEAPRESFADQRRNGLGYNDDTGFETSDDEVTSTKVEGSQVGSPGRDNAFSSAPSTAKARQGSARFLDSGAPIRPTLTTHATDVMFNGDGFSSKDPSRGISYPAPSGASPRLRNNLSPNSQRSSDVPSERTVTSPQSRPLTPQDPQQTAIHPTIQDTSPPRDADVKPSRIHPSLRFQLPRLPSSKPPTPSNALPPPPSRSVASRMFRRNTQATANPVAPTVSAPQAQPSSRPRLPRPSSLYAARPGTSDGTNDASTSNIERQRMNRRHSAVMDDGSLALGKDTFNEEHIGHEGMLRGMGRSASVRIKEGLSWRR